MQASELGMLRRQRGSMYSCWRSYSTRVLLLRCRWLSHRYMYLNSM